MAHLRTQIRNAVAAALAGLPTTGTRVYAHGVWSVAEDKLPCLTVETGDELVSAITMPPNPLSQRDLEIVVTALAATTENMDTTLDAIAAEVEPVMAALALPGLRPAMLKRISTEMEPAAVPVGRMRLHYQTTYFTHAITPHLAC